ncbi:MAG: T9SS type A sorting domain-containing protein [Bacteroidetes bacterium]|nr:T9SS type A sorting domain-containing protein [Bacteroidota bacterium]
MKLDVYPIPFSDEINILVETNKVGERVELNIYSIAGIKVFSQNVNAGDMTTISGKDLQAGVAFLRAVTETQVLNKKIMKLSD